MSLDAPVKASPVVHSADDLVDWLRVGEKPASSHRVGLETEKIGVVAATGEPVPLPAIGRLLSRLADTTGGKVLVENETPIGVQYDGYSVALEPGGQLELSGAPVFRLRELGSELHRHLAQVEKLSEAEGLAWLGVGYRPFGERSAVPWLPRGRYALMRQRMRGAYAHDMMQMTASVQANFDWTDEQDLAAKVSAATAVSPIVSALFANAPLREGRDAGMSSFRLFLWSDVDPPRSGLLRVMYEPGFTYRRYVDWMLNVPLLFVRRAGGYHDPDGRTFADLMRDGFEGEPATMVDFTDLVSTLFPEVRVKRVIEVRGADAVSTPMTLALPALWTGILYDKTALADARRLVDASFEELQAFHRSVARGALMASLGKRSARDLGADLVQIASEGLKRRAERGEGDPGDAAMLNPLRDVLRTGRTPADKLRDIASASNGDRKAIIQALRLTAQA